MSSSYCFINDTATTEIYTLHLHDALPICRSPPGGPGSRRRAARTAIVVVHRDGRHLSTWVTKRSEEHTSELQSRQYLVCRLLLEIKDKGLGAKEWNKSLKTKLSLLPKKLF